MSQAAQYSGLEAWASRIRHDLASATGMAEFTDRVQTRGFDWMSSFVNSVLNDEYAIRYFNDIPPVFILFIGR